MGPRITAQTKHIMYLGVACLLLKLLTFYPKRSPAHEFTLWHYCVTARKGFYVSLPYNIGDNSPIGKYYDSIRRCAPGSIIRFL